jgi:hypothetical protein
MVSIDNYISKQELTRQKVLSDIHQVILEAEPKIEASIGEMMGKPMIIYKGNGSFKYGLAGVKDYMSLHLLPMYGAPAIHEKYSKALNRAKFQKGCINFKEAADMPLDIVRSLLKDCATIDLLALRNEYLASKKKTKSK